MLFIKTGSSTGIRNATCAPLRANVNSRAYYPCGNSSCTGRPFVDPLLSPPCVFEATNCRPYQLDRFRFQGANQIELTWRCTSSPSLCPPHLCDNPNCGTCSKTVSDIGGISNERSPSVPYICLSSGQLAASTLYETAKRRDPGQRVLSVGLKRTSYSAFGLPRITPCRPATPSMPCSPYVGEGITFTVFSKPRGY